MRYYCISCRVGTEELNIKILNAIISSHFQDSNHFVAYSPLREVYEYRKRVKDLVRQPLLPGYIIVETEYDLLPVTYIIRSMSRTCYGLLTYPDRTIELKNKDLSFARWIFENNGYIKPSKVKITKSVATGNRIEIMSGPLKNFTGKIIRLYKDTKVTVEVEFLNEIKRVNLPIEVVEVIREDTEVEAVATKIMMENSTN